MSGWTIEKYKSFSDEIDKVHEEVSKNLGHQDIEYIQFIKRISRMSEITGRSFLFLSFDPITWLIGVLALWIHKQVEGMEIGHHALHGSWDQYQETKNFHSSTFRWDCPIEENAWKNTHNKMHHYSTNIVGQDPDVNMGFLRLSKETPWSPIHFFQIFEFLFSAPLFTWFAAFKSGGIIDLFRPGNMRGYCKILPNKRLDTVFEKSKPSIKKMGRYFLKNYVFWPALAGPFWLKVFLGNFLADTLRNIFACFSIYPGHFGTDVKYHSDPIQINNRGEWYKYQIESTRNFAVPRILSILLAGGLDHQIEHHLFPKLPPNRLREIQPQIHEICSRYGISYSRRSWPSALVDTISRLLKMSVP